MAVRGYRIFDIHTFSDLAEHSFAGSLDEEYITTFGQQYDYLKRLEGEPVEPGGMLTAWHI